MLSAPRVVVYAVVVAYLITVFLPFTMTVTAPEAAQAIVKHILPGCVSSSTRQGKRAQGLLPWSIICFFIPSAVL